MRELILDTNAHKPMCQKALKAFNDFNNSFAAYGHAMSPNGPGRAAAEVLEESRGKIARLLGAKPGQIFFTSTCTQACEWAVVMMNRLSAGRTVHWSPAEHPAIKYAVKKNILNRYEIPVNSDGVIEIDSLNLQDIVCIHMQNEIGIIQPIEKLNPKYLLSDMSQSAGKLEINLSSLPVDIAVFGAHKFGGPTSVGFIYIKKNEYWMEFGTGSRYYTDRTGTPDVAGIVATAAALEDAMATLPERKEKMIEFKNVLEPGLMEMGFNIIGLNAERCPNTTFVHMPDGKGLIATLALGEHGIHVGLGSACGAAHTGTNPLMSKLGYDGESHDFMRISQFGEYGADDARVFLDSLKKCLQN